MYDADPDTGSRTVLGSLGGIDFGPDDGPGRGYGRVVEAELASEALDAIERAAASDKEAERIMVL